MTRILVTGGAGYIGAHVCKALAAAGFLPVTLDNLSTGHRAAVRWGPLVELDLADGARLKPLLAEGGFAAVMHFAASIEVAESVADPRKYYANNLAASLTLLAAMIEAGIPAIVFSSTGATYGIAERVPIGEDHPQRPINPYGETKLAVERALRWYGAAYGLRWAALRYFNAAGADPAGEIGEAHEPEIHLIPLVIGACLGTRPPVRIMGTDYPTPDGTAIRDYIHVADLAEAHVRVLRRLLAGGASLALNLGTGTGRSVREVLAVAARVTGILPPAEAAPRRPGDPPALVADAGLMRRELGWQPERSDLETIIETALRWHRRPAWGAAAQ